MFTVSSAYSSKAGETKQMTEANNSMYNEPGFCDFQMVSIWRISKC